VVPAGRHKGAATAIAIGRVPNSAAMARRAVDRRPRGSAAISVPPARAIGSLAGREPMVLRRAATAPGMASLGRMVRLAKSVPTDGRPKALARAGLEGRARLAVSEASTGLLARDPMGKVPAVRARSARERMDLPVTATLVDPAAPIKTVHDDRRPNRKERGKTRRRKMMRRSQSRIMGKQRLAPVPLPILRAR
jgi:hypothetical protein